MSDMTEKRHFTPHYMAKIACGDLPFIKSGTLWDRNQGPVNGIREQKGSAKN